MKIAYISPIYFSDVDLSYLAEAQKMMDITYFFPVTKWQLKGAAINLDSQYSSNGIFKAVDVYPQLCKYKDVIDLNKTYVINYCGNSTRSLKNIWNSVRLVKFLIKNQFDIIHLTEFPCPYQYPLYLLRKKIILTVHDPIPHSAKISNLSPILRNRKISFKLIKNFILLNKVQKTSFIEKNNLSNANIYESELGAYCYLKKINPIKHETTKYILFFGQITEHKGLDILFPAICNVHKKYSNIKLICAGNGKIPFDTKFYEELKYFDIRNRFIPDDELASLIEGSEFIVCPYKDATQSGVVMSAYAFCKPVVATNVGGLPEMIINGETGCLIPPNDIEILSNVMIDLLDNPTKLVYFSENIKNRYHKGYKTWRNISIKMMNIYNKFIENER